MNLGRLVLNLRCAILFDESLNEGEIALRERQRADKPRVEIESLEVARRSPVFDLEHKCVRMNQFEFPSSFIFKEAPKIATVLFSSARQDEILPGRQVVPKVI